MTDERFTDVGNARRLIERVKGNYRYVPAWGTWLHWDDQRWQTDTKGTIVEQAKGVARDLFTIAQCTSDSEERKRTFKWAIATEAAARIDAMIRLARTEEGVPVDPHELDANHWILTVANGTIDLRTGRLHTHSRDDLCTKLADVRYHPHADAPHLQAFLERIFPDPDVIEFVARWAGYCLTGDVSEHKIAFFHGVGANGKSTLLNALSHVMGDYAREAAPDLLMRRMNDPHPTGLADLHGARLVLASETAQNRHLDEALVKRLTGGDKVKARHMHKDFFEFDPTHKIVVATNHRPAIDGTDHGIWRRVRLVPFSVVIPDDQQDRHLDQKLAAEAPGILAWAVQACLRWQAHGLGEPTAVTAATADYRADMDILGDFISDSCVLLSDVSARSSDLYGAYTRWSEAMGERPISQRKLGSALRERGLEQYRSNGIWWRGIALKARDTEPSRSADADI